MDVLLVEFEPAIPEVKLSATIHVLDESKDILI
jgi:hypothetical protein